MQKSRTRQFNSTRNRNLSQTYSQAASSSICSSSVYQQPVSNGPSTSSFLKKTQTPVCPNCVNRKLISQKQEKAEKDKKDQLLQTQQHFQKLNKLLDKVTDNRLKLAQEAQQYNRTVAAQSLRSSRSEKLLDSAYIKEACQKEEEQRQQELLEIQLKKQREEQYRQELKKQCHLELRRKQREKEEIIYTPPNQPLLNSHSSVELGQKQASILLQQISEQKRARQQKKALQNQLNRKAQQQTQRKFLQYSEFKNTKRYQYNPQMFQQMKQLQNQRKLDQLQLRQTAQKQRKLQLIKAKRQMELNATKSIQKAKDYADLLQQQIKEKRIEVELKMEEQRKHREVYPKFTQEIQKQTHNKKPCGQCHQQVQQKALAYY